MSEREHLVTRDDQAVRAVRERLTPKNNAKQIVVRGRIYTGEIPARYNAIGRHSDPHLMDTSAVTFVEPQGGRRARQLEARYGRGFNPKSVRTMLQFASLFSDEMLVATLSRQLGWSHFAELIPVKGALAREF